MLNREKSQEYRAQLLQYLDQKRSEVKIVDNERFTERGGGYSEISEHSVCVNLIHHSSREPLYMFLLRLFL